MNIETIDRTRQLPGTDRDLDSVSEIDRDLLLGERRESDWKDARKMNEKTRQQNPRGPHADSNEPALEDGAD